MSELTGQQWMVENKGGSGGNVGMDALAQSAPDGYTLGLGGIASHAIAPTLYAKLPFNPRTDFTFVSTIWQLPNMLVVNLDLPAKSVPELIELLKKNPGKYSYGSAGSGTTLHLSGELFKIMAKVDMVHVPYRGAAPAMQDLLAGQIHMIFDNIPGALAQSRARQGARARRHLGRAHAGRARRAGDRRDAARLRHQLVDHAHRPGEAAARSHRAAVGAVEEGAGERRPQGQVPRPRGDGDLALAGRHAGLPRFGRSAARADYQGVRRACRLAGCKTLTTAQAVVSMLEVNGIDTIFCLPGVQNDPFFDALYDRTNAIRPIHARHEQACAYMALGYAMASGKPSAYVVVPGPGFLNTTAALSTAYAVNAPVLALTGQIQQAMIGRNVGLLHELPDQLAIMRGLTKWADRITRAGRGARPDQRSLPPPAVGPASSGRRWNAPWTPGRARRRSS